MGFVFKRNRRSVVAKASQPCTWSNPDGLTLKKLQPTLFVAERPFVWNSIDVGGKMAVVKLTDGTLWVHSPVNLDPDLRQELAELGEVKHIVSPNYEHVKYAQQWIDAYPDATSYACPGLIEHEPSISFQKTVGEKNAPPEGWPSQILVTHLDYDVNPFTKKVFFNEVVFVDTVSKTLFVTDAFWNFPSDVPLGTKLWKFGMDKVYKGFSSSFMVTSRGAFDAAMSRILGQDWDSLLPCHGTYINSGGKQSFREFMEL